MQRGAAVVVATLQLLGVVGSKQQLENRGISIVLVARSEH
jgi:hypothetical protein